MSLLSKGFSSAYFSQKTHLQLALSVITPPNSGPRVLLKTNTPDMIFMYFGTSLTDTIAGTMADTIEVMPDPAMP